MHKPEILLLQTVGFVLCYYIPSEDIFFTEHCIEVLNEVPTEQEYHINKLCHKITIIILERKVRLESLQNRADICISNFFGCKIIDGLLWILNHGWLFFLSLIDMVW